jgi:hypothetical protein
LDEIENLYNAVNDFNKSNINYPGWKKGVYPVRETAIIGINNNGLFVLRLNNKILGTVILSNEPEIAYKDVTWGIKAEYKDIIVYFAWS